MGKAAIHKASLVRAAMRLFRRQGFASTGLQQILSASGAPKGSLYHYFPNGKEALGAAAIELSADDLQEIDRAASQIEIHGARYTEQMQKMVGR